jgi:hypothetical protein
VAFAHGLLTFRSSTSRIARWWLGIPSSPQGERSALGQRAVQLTVDTLSSALSRSLAHRHDRLIVEQNCPRGGRRRFVRHVVAVDCLPIPRGYGLGVKPSMTRVMTPSASVRHSGRS